MNKLEIVGKALLGIVEVGAGAMQSQARTRSRDRKMSEEYRNKYSEMADSFGNIKSVTHDYKEKMGTDDALDDYDNYCEENYELSDKSTYNSFDLSTNDNRRIFDKRKYAENEDNQKKCASSDTDIGLLSIEEWDRKWQQRGKFDELNDNLDFENSVGLIRFIYNDHIVYITRAIDLKNGGIDRKLQELLNYTGKKGRIYGLLTKYHNDIYVETLLVGNESAAINICRNIERELIKKNKPEWM